MNRVAKDEVRGGSGLVLRNLDPFRPLVVAMILAAVAGLMVLILLLSPRKRVPRPRRGRLFVFRSGVAEDVLQEMPQQTAPIARATLAEPEHFFGLLWTPRLPQESRIETKSYAILRTNRRRSRLMRTLEFTKPQASERLQDARTTYNLGVLLANRGDLEESLRAIERAASLGMQAANQDAQWLRAKV